MRALFLIPKNDSPVLEGSQYSKLFKEFISLCLQKDPDKRPSAKDLLKHKWIKNAKKSNSLIDLIHEHEQWLKLEVQNDNSSLSDDSETFYRQVYYSILV